MSKLRTPPYLRRQILREIENDIHSITSASRTYNVTRATITRWRAQYNLPPKKHGRPPLFASEAEKKAHQLQYFRQYREKHKKILDKK